jgi:hypothetical protein
MRVRVGYPGVCAQRDLKRFNGKLKGVVGPMVNILIEDRRRRWGGTSRADRLRGKVAGQCHELPRSADRLSGGPIWRMPVSRWGSGHFEVRPWAPTSPAGS